MESKVDELNDQTSQNASGLFADSTNEPQSRGSLAA